MVWPFRRRTKIVAEERVLEGLWERIQKAANVRTILQQTRELRSSLSSVLEALRNLYAAKKFVKRPREVSWKMLEGVIKNKENRERAVAAIFLLKQFIQTAIDSFLKPLIILIGRILTDIIEEKKTIDAIKGSDFAKLGREGVRAELLSPYLKKALASTKKLKSLREALQKEEGQLKAAVEKINLLEGSLGAIETVIEKSQSLNVYWKTYGIDAKLERKLEELFSAVRKLNLKKISTLLIEICKIGNVFATMLSRHKEDILFLLELERSRRLAYERARKAGF